MAYVVDNLPRAGTPLLFQHNGGVFHRAVIDTGMVITNCGRRYYIPGTKLAIYHPDLIASPNHDVFDWPMIPYQGQRYRCQKCR